MDGLCWYHAHHNCTPCVSMVTLLTVQFCSNAHKNAKKCSISRNKIQKFPPTPYGGETPSLDTFGILSVALDLLPIALRNHRYATAGAVASLNFNRVWVQHCSQIISNDLTYEFTTRIIVQDEFTRLSYLPCSRIPMRCYQHITAISCVNTGCWRTVDVLLTYQTINAKDDKMTLIT